MAIVERRQDEAILRLALNDPERANVLSRPMMDALRREIEAVAQDAEVRVVVLEARGRIFCAGHDLGELRAAADEAERRAIFDQCSALMLALRDCPRPVIAKVEGAAVAAGCQLVAACDLAYAAAGARFAVSGVNLGLFCSTPAVALSRRVAAGPALEMLLTGRFVDAQEAQAIGLVNRALEAERLEAHVAQIAGEIAAKAPEAVALGKAFFWRQAELPLAAAYEAASERMATNLGLACAAEGIDGFLAPRPARARS